MDVNSLKKRLLSSDMEDFHEVINEVCHDLKDLNKSLFENVSRNPDLIRADVLFKYISLLPNTIKELLAEETDDDVRFCYLLFLYVSGDKNTIPELLPYAAKNDITQSLQVINKLSHERIKELIPIIKAKLIKSDFKEFDYLVALLRASKRMGIELPQEFVKNIPKEVPWIFKATLEEDFNIRI